MKWRIWKSTFFFPGKWVAEDSESDYWPDHVFETWQAAMDYVIEETR